MAALKIAIPGISGRMGQMLVRECLGDARFELVGAMDRPGAPWIGQDLGSAMGRAAMGIIVTDEPNVAIEHADVVIDFTLPQATEKLVQITAQHGVAHVIGTTGFDDNQLDIIAKAGQSTAIMRAGNMSLGVNLLTKLTEQVARALGEEFDIEIIEAHHNKKVDAPSGTALMLGEAAAAGRGVVLDAVADRGRDGITGERKTGDIGFTAIRGGDIVGEHDVLFAGMGERIVLRHLATDRALFARGALKAALWTKGKVPGYYNMHDVLGL